MKPKPLVKIEMTTILISKRNRQRLGIIKKKLKISSMDNTIDKLIKIYTGYKIK